MRGWLLVALLVLWFADIAAAPEARDNRQFCLNVVRWLTSVLNGG